MVAKSGRLLLSSPGMTTRSARSRRPSAARGSTQHGVDRHHRRRGGLCEVTPYGGKRTMNRRLSRVVLVIWTLGVLVDSAAAQDVTGPRVNNVTVHSDPQDADTYVLGNKIRVTVWFTEEIEVTGSPTLDLQIGTETRQMTRPCPLCGGGPGINFEYVVQATDYDADGISVLANALKLNGGKVTDMAGNNADLDLGEHAFSNDPAHKVDGGRDPGPVVTRLEVLSTPASGDTYGRGEEIVFRIFFDEPLVVSGSPRVALSIGAERRFAVVDTRVVPSDRLIRFVYRVQAQDRDSDGFSITADALRMDGGSIRDRTGNDADLSLAGYTVINAAGHRVNGGKETRPILTDVSLAGTPSGDDETFIRGDELRVYLTFNRNVVTTGSPTVALTIGARIREATLNVRREDYLVFAYNVQADDSDADGVSLGADAIRLNGGSIRDAAGTDADLNLAGYVVTNDPRFKVDGSVNYPPRVDIVQLVSQPREDDTYRWGEGIHAQIAFNEPVTVTGRPVLEIEVGTETRRAYAIPTGYDGQFFVEFQYSVQPPDLDLDGVSIGPGALILEGGSIRDAAGNVAETDLGHRTISNDALHKVDGGQVRAIGTLPPLELAVGSTETVDLSEVFHGAFAIAYAATSSNPDVAEVSLSGSSLTVAAVGEGTATIETTARDEFGTASVQFLVTAMTDPAEAEALESTLAAMGRSLLSSVTMTLEGRFAAASGAPSVAVAGRRVPSAADAEVVRAQLGGAPRPMPVPAGAVADAPLQAARQARVHAAVAGGLQSGRLTGESLLRGSRFVLAVDRPQAEDEAAADGTSWTVWGSGDLQSFAGEPGNGVGYDGSLRAGHVGVDVGGEHWLAGAFVSRAAGEASYRFGTNGAGNLQATLTNVQPYFRWSPSRRAEVWMAAGVGSGTLELERVHARGRVETSDLSMRLAVVGGRRVLASAGRVDIALRGDVGLVRLETRGGTQVLEGLAANAQRYRVGVETSHTTRWSNGATLTPFVEVAGRRDDGDGEVGNGVEVAGGLRLAHPESGFGLEARGRVLALHSAAGYREHGFGVTARLTPSGSDGRGLSLAVTPGWGAPVGGADALWREQAFGRAGMAALADDASVDARVGYGFGLRAGQVLTPFGEVGVYGAEHRRLRAGVRLGRATRYAAPLHVELAGERNETGWGYVDRRLGVIGTLSF